MKQKEVFKKIGGIIQELREQYEYLETVSDNLNDLELELFVANAHFLTDHIEILCKLNLQNRPKRPLIEKPESGYGQKFFEPVVQQMKPGIEAKEIKTPKSASKPVEVTIAEPEKPIEKRAEKEKQPEADTGPTFDFSSQTPEDSYSFVREEPETIRHELVLDEAETWEDESEPAADEVKPATEKLNVAADKEQETETPAIIEEEQVLPEAQAQIEEITTEEVPAKAITEDRPAEAEAGKEEDEVITRNQKISSQMGDKALSKTEQLSIKPISDIKLAITLNDKLLYVKDLFNGYNLAYSEAIEILNRFNTFEEAQRFLKTNYVTKNNWEGKAATAEKFYALLRRRYA